MEKELFHKASAYSDAALSFIDDDGYPFSIPVSFEIDQEEQTVAIDKPRNIPSLLDREITIIFNHITPLPGGGYTDRRYVVLWGRVSDEGDRLRLKATKGYAWDEKEVPFFQYSEMKVHRGREYLNELKEKPWLSTPWLVLRTFRLPFVIATVLPVALGAAIAYRSGIFDWALFALTMLGALLLHLGVNTANDYFDSRSGADDINTTPTPFSGGSRVIQYGLLPSPAVFSLSTATYAAGSIIGLYLALTRGWPILAIGVLGILMSYGYTAPPLKLVYRGLGELTVATSFGPLLVLGSYFVQTRTFSLESFVASIPIGIMVMLILYVNEIPDKTWDDEASKMTLVARMSERSVLAGYTLSVSVVYAVIALGAILRILPLTALLGLLTIPLAVRIRRMIKSNSSNPYALMPAMSANIKMFVFTTLLLLAGYAISHFVAI